MSCSLLLPTPVSAHSLKINSNRRCQTLTFYPRRVAGSTSVTTKQTRLLVAWVVKKGALAESKASPSIKGEGEVSGNESPPAVAFSSGFSLNLPSIPSAWNMWLVGAAMLVTVPIYRRMKRVEAVMEEAEKTAEAAKEIMDTVAKEAGDIDADVANMTDEESVSEIARKMEYIADKIESNTQKAEDVLKKVEHIKEEVEELLETKMSQGEAEERINK